MKLRDVWASVLWLVLRMEGSEDVLRGIDWWVFVEGTLVEDWSRVAGGLSYGLVDSWSIDWELIAGELMCWLIKSWKESWDGGVWFCFVLFCFVLFCFVLFCFVLFCFVLFCFVLFIQYICMYLPIVKVCTQSNLRDCEVCINRFLSSQNQRFPNSSQQTPYIEDNLFLII